MSRLLPPVTPGHVSPAFLQSVVGGEAKLILEIGAHHGWHTGAFLQVFPNATFHCFEPDPRAAAMFRERLSDPRLHLHEMAIGARDGVAEFHVSSGLPPDMSPEDLAEYPSGWDQSGSLRAPKRHTEFWPWCKFEQSIEVKVRALDSWAAENGIGDVDFIWADMQGAEGDLIRGGAATLARTRFVYTEYSDQEIYEGEPSLGELLDLLPKFTVVRRYEHDVLLKNTFR